MAELPPQPNPPPLPGSNTVPGSGRAAPLAGSTQPDPPPPSLLQPTGEERLREPLNPWLIALAAALLLAALAAWFLLARRRKRPATDLDAPPRVPPHVRARHQLEAALQLLGDPNAFCTELSRILRRYLEERFGWNAPDRTTEEFLLQLRSQDQLPPEFQQLLAEFLTRCDQVKFARHDPTEPELHDLHRAALRVVDDTVPPPPPPDSAPGGPQPLPNP